MSASPERSHSMPGWYWPEGLGTQGQTSSPNGTAHPDPSTQSGSENGTAHPAGAPRGEPESRKPKHWPPRTCRICLETVLPTFNPPPENVPGVFQSGPSVSYQSEEGRLIRPCRCKGSSRYVHENCLQAWRHADPGYGRRNYFQCPTCGYQYRMARMSWGRLISSTMAQITLTVLVIILAAFLLGFVADPIINLYLDPVSTFIPSSGNGEDYVRVVDEEQRTWLQHFFKGTASLGVLGFLKVLLSSPFQWIRLGGGNTRARAARTGRDRAGDISWIVIVVGIATFAYAVWKGVRAWSRRTLERAGERVMDVQGDVGDDGDEDDDNDENDQAGSTAAPPGA